jgi:hypothetical protein
MMSADQVERLAAKVGILDADAISGEMLIALVNEALRTDPVRQTALEIAKTYANAVRQTVPVVDIDDIEPELDRLCDLLGVETVDQDAWEGSCGDCSGSGEGMFDGSTCRTCGGSGVSRPS